MNEDTDSVVSQSPGGALLENTPARRENNIRQPPSGRPQTPINKRHVSQHRRSVEVEPSPPYSLNERSNNSARMSVNPFDGGQPSLSGVGPPPAQFAEIRDACYAAQPICFHLQTALHRQAGLTEEAQANYYRDMRSIGDRILAIQLAITSLEQDTFTERSRTASAVATLRSQLESAVHDGDQLRHQVRMLQTELSAYEDASIMPHRVRGNGAPINGSHPAYSQVVGDLRRRADQEFHMPVRHPGTLANPVTPGRHLGGRYAGSVRGTSYRGRVGSVRGRLAGDHMAGRQPSISVHNHSHHGSFNSQNSSSTDGFSSGGGMPLLTMQPHSSVVGDGLGSPTRRPSQLALENLRTSAYGDHASKHSSTMHSRQSDVPIMGPTPRQLAKSQAQVRAMGQYGYGKSTHHGHGDGDSSDGGNYWAAEDGGSPIPLLKTELGLRSTSDIRPPGAIGGRPPSADGGDIDAPSPGGNSSLHPSSSASNIKPRKQSPQPFRGQITPQLQEGPAAAMHQAKEVPLRKETLQLHTQQSSPAYPAGQGGQQQVTRNRQASGPTREQQQMQLQLFEQAGANKSVAMFEGEPEEDGLILDAVGKEWRKEFDQVYTYVIGWVRSNCNKVSVVNDAQIPRKYPRLWEYMLELTYPDHMKNAASHVQFLLSDPEVRCYFICRMLVQFLVFHVFSIDAWMADDPSRTGTSGQLRGPTKHKLAMLIRMRDGLGDSATPEQRRRVQTGQAECVVEMLSHPDWPSVRQQRVSDIVHRFKEMAGPLMREDADRALASHDLYGIAVNAIETSARVLSARLNFVFGFSDCGVKFSDQMHYAINAANIGGVKLQQQQWRVMCVVTPNMTIRDDGGPTTQLRNIAKAKVMVMP
ncbi:hypothetical protein MCOR02_007136 [Pyricularia oryzae]|nr:hypothetical protein MCOR02_007136 [Pyricularia oryzae]KAI6302868.1 hypothetical protein MCOR34_008891 [Pyricularia oryzae]KAI6468179.1 hypothetical protein MCOR17_004180 [Pyricularia oryzae]KAI6577904.1 hypothetical protein MCOR04_006559 [Pyricularia oryzae]